MKKGIAILMTLVFMSFAMAGCNKASKSGKSNPEADGKKTVETGSSSVTGKTDPSTGTTKVDPAAENKTGTASTGTANSSNPTTSGGTETSQNTEKGAELAVSDFIAKFYIVEDCKNIDLDSLNTKYPNDKYSNNLRMIAEEDALQTVFMDRTQLVYLYTCAYSHINAKISSKDIVKRSSGDDTSVLYNYSAKLQLTFPDENNKQVEEEVCGQLTLKQKSGKWIITQVNKADAQSIIDKYRLRH